ncbi:D-isomer specific 2-hydroxyacid dehydrogenase family protein [Geodermatophilus sp. DSM 45219]|uniref:NAD(P)-dependent oxidoreductase n=1 Tax=Geodermatophilus sp. DSM 45219 TaxID=1881103 RepID=UPI00087FA29C|nr:2-hydroxyacid dehydrogenase [Geodermatophilus sp. DSM 45219]SDN56644.1 glyoxylate reductase [Geodermatophilus sp. DSM 45219]
MSEGPHVLFWGPEGPVSGLYRERLPDGWRLSTLRDRDDEEGKLRLLPDVDVVVHTDNTPLTRAHLDAARRLRLVHRQGVGLDAVDQDELRARGVALAVCTAGTAESVAEHTVLLALAAGRHLVRLHDDVARQGRWPKWDYRSTSVGLAGSTVGLVGFGRIGQAVARAVLALGSDVLVHRRRGGPLGAEWAGRPVRAAASLDELFAAADVVSLHCPLLPENRGMVDARRLGLMREHAVFVNTARGGLVVQDDLVAALRAGRPAAAGLDVFAQEPVAADDPLLCLPNVVVTPHCAAGTRTTSVQKAQAVLDNIGRFWAGEPVEDRVV